MEENKKNIVVPLVIGGAIVAVTLVAGTLVFTGKSNANNTSSNSDSTNTTSAVSTTTAILSSAQYKDGTYTADGSYISPGGQGLVGVTLTIKNGSIQTINVQPKSQDRESEEYETRFSQGISSVVVGKSLNDSLNVGRVNGSSLTGTGFLDAISKIKTQAQS